MPKKVTPIPKPSHPRFFFREWRKYRGLNQEALAEIVGVTTSTISQLETGKQGFTDFRLNDGNVKRHTMERLESFVSGTKGKRLTYKGLIQ